MLNHRNMDGVIRPVSDSTVTSYPQRPPTSMSDALRPPILGQQPQHATQRPPQQPARPPPACVCCNQCRKPLTTTLYVVNCDCVFCEECTFSHFNTSSNCPCCHKPVSEADFLELVVADPSQAQHESTKQCFQTMFTKQVADKQTLTFQEMSSRLVRSMDDNNRAARFLLKQFMVESASHNNRSSEYHRAYQRAKDECTQLKQSTAAQKLQFERGMADLQNKLQSMQMDSQNKLQALASELTDYKKQNAQLRKVLVRDGLAEEARPSSSSSQTSGGKRGPSQPQQQQHHYHHRLPLEGIMGNMQAQPLRNQRLHQQQQCIPTMARPAVSHDGSAPMMTPIQPQNQFQSFSPRSDASNRSYASNTGYQFSYGGGGGGRGGGSDGENRNRGDENSVFSINIGSSGVGGGLHYPRR